MSVWAESGAPALRGDGAVRFPGCCWGRGTAATWRAVGPTRVEGFILGG